MFVGADGRVVSDEAPSLAWADPLIAASPRLNNIRLGGDLRSELEEDGFDVLQLDRKLTSSEANCNTITGADCEMIEEDFVIASYYVPCRLYTHMCIYYSVVPTH